MHAGMWFAELLGRGWPRCDGVMDDPSQASPGVPHPITKGEKVLNYSRKWQWSNCTVLQVEQPDNKHVDTLFM